MRRRSDQRGFVGGFEALPFGLLVFAAGSLLLANAWAVIDANAAASSAAREAVRVLVESADGDASAASARAMETIEGYGKERHRASVEWSGTFRRCRPVTATVRYRVPTVLVPWIASFGGVVTTSASHTAIVDPYRSGPAVGHSDPESCEG